MISAFRRDVSLVSLTLFLRSSNDCLIDGMSSTLIASVIFLIASSGNARFLRVARNSSSSLSVRWLISSCAFLAFSIASEICFSRSSRHRSGSFTTSGSSHSAPFQKYILVVSPTFRNNMSPFFKVPFGSSLGISVPP